MAALLLLTLTLLAPTSAVVPVELVSGKSVVAFQTGAWSGMTAEKAVDGYKDRTDSGAEYYKSVCAHPDTGDRATPAQWSVDLGGIYRIFSITVWNSYDSGASIRMRNFEVGVEQTGQDDVICGSRGDTPVPAGSSDTFTCPGIVTGSGVFLRKLFEAPEPHLITICEVTVDGIPSTTTVLPISTSPLPTVIPRNENIALGKPTNQTGTHKDDPRWISAKAVNGQYDKVGFNDEDKLINCARVDSPGDPGQPAEWWVDLGELYTVTTVLVHNTFWIDAYFQLKYFTIDVIHPDTGVTECGRDDSGTPIPQGGSYRATCNIVGRYVRFRRFDGDDVDRVTLCEVEVAGEIYRVSYDYTNQHVATSAQSSTSLTLVWDQIPVSSGPSQDYGYLVVYLPTDGGAERQEDVQYDSSVTRRSLTLSGLSSNTQYQVEIRPYRLQDGVRVYGDNFPRQRITTPCGAPDQAENVQTATKVASGDTNERIEITYELPSVTGCNSIEAVWVEYRPQTGGSWLSTGADTVGDPITVTVDAPGTYSLRLHIRNDGNQQRVTDLPAVVVNAVPVTPAPTPPASGITPAPSDSPTPSPDDSPTPATAVSSTAISTQTSKADDTSSVCPECKSSGDTILAVSVTVCVVVISLSVFGTTWLVLRHRRMHASSPVYESEKHTYVNQQAEGLGPGAAKDRSSPGSDPQLPDPTPHPQDPGVYEEVNGAKQYEAVTMETREPPPQDDAYQQLQITESTN